jgi:hypothetical protein
MHARRFFFNTAFRKVTFGKFVRIDFYGSLFPCFLAEQNITQNPKATHISTFTQKPKMAPTDTKNTVAHN